MHIMIKTDVVFYAIFHVEHIMSSTHVVCGSALLLDERWSSFLPKKSSSLLIMQQPNKTTC